MMNKITTINGILMTAQNDFTEHVENTTVHVTEQEKEKWNKAPVTDAAGNMSLSGNLTVQSGTFRADVAMNGNLSVSESLNLGGALDVAGEATCFRMNVYSADYFQMYIQTGVGVFRNTGMNAFRFEGNGSDELEVRLGASSGTARLFKLNQKNSPSGNDVLNAQENDARYGQKEEENTWTKPQTHEAAINAEGGMEIPLAAGAEKNTSAVNRMHAAGLAAVADVYNVQAYLTVSSSSVTGIATINERVPGHFLQIITPKSTSSTARIAIDQTLVGRANYCKFGGVFLPLRFSMANAQVKISVALGLLTTSTRLDRAVDDYTFVPVTSSVGFGEVLDITITDTRDSAAMGYWVRVREIYGLRELNKYLVKTTRSLLPLNSNTSIPLSIGGIVYQQRSDGGLDTDDRGALWLMVTGIHDNVCWRIASVRGIHTFETNGLDGMCMDMYNNSTTRSAYASVGAPRIMQRCLNGYNPAYYGFSAIEANAIQTEVVEDFTDPDAQAPS